MDIKPIRTPPRKRKRARNPNPEVRQRLLDAAGGLIREEGFPKLRVEEVAERAGLSVGTFYLYFEGKQDLFANLLIEHTKELRDALHRAYRTSGTVAERLSSGLDAFLDFVWENQKGFLYFRDAGTVQTTIGRLSTWAFQILSQELKPLLVEAMESNEMRREDAELSAQAILGQFFHIAGYWLENKDRYSREEIKRFLTRLSSVGLVPRPLESRTHPPRER